MGLEGGGSAKHGEMHVIVTLEHNHIIIAPHETVESPR